MLTAADQLASLTERVRAFDAKRAMIVGEAICSGVFAVHASDIESIAATQEDQRDREVLSLEKLELHGWDYWQTTDGTRWLRGLPSCPILPERAPSVLSTKKPTQVMGGDAPGFRATAAPEHMSRTMGTGH